MNKTYHFWKVVNNTNKKPGTCNKSTETDNKSTQTDDSFREYLKQQIQEKQQEPPKENPQEKGNPSLPGQTLKPVTPLSQQPWR